jgi:hypothetical protein
MFARLRHCPLSSAKWIRYTSSHPICLTSILILSSHLRLSLPGSPFIPSGFQTTASYAIVTFHMRVTWPAYLVHVHSFIVIIFCEEYKLVCNIRLNYVLLISFQASGTVWRTSFLQFLEVIGRI